MEIKAILKQIHPIVVRGEKNFESRKIWLDTDTDGKYPQVIEIQASGEKVGIFDGVSIGAPVTCHINLRGREWAGTDGVAKVFNTLECWKVEANGLPPIAATPIAEVVLPETGDLPF